MSVPNITDDTQAIQSTDSVADEALLKQYQEQYQQLLSQYEDASTAWKDTAPGAETGVDESVQLAINSQLDEAEAKLDALKAAVDASEPSEETLKTAAEACKASVSNVAAYIAAVPMMVADLAAVTQLQETCEHLSDADKTLLGSEFTQAMEAKFTAFNEKIDELKEAIKEGKEPSVIQNLQTEIAAGKTQLDTLTNGTTDSSVMSITDRIDCLKSLEDSKKYLEDEAYATFKQQLLSTDVSKQISKEDFQTQLVAATLPAAQKEGEKAVESNEVISKQAAAVNELLKNNIALKVMQANNSFLEFKFNVEADAKLQEEAEFNPQVKQLRDEGRWQTPNVTRQQEMQELNEDERRREKTAQMR